MELSDDSRIEFGQDVLYKEVTGEMVMLDLEQELYFGLDAVGSRMWQLVEQEGRFGSVVEALLAEYDVSREQLTKDLSELISRLQGENLVTVS